MTGRNDLLRNDRTFVQFIGHKMRRSANQFYAALECLTVWAGAGECRQKRMVDIDDAPGKLRHKCGRQDAHEFGQYNIVRLQRLDMLHQQRFELFLAYLLMRNMMERNIES